MKKPASFAVITTIALSVLASATVLAQDDELALKEEQAIKDAVARVAPSVARIETVGGLEVVGKSLVGTGPTTGVVVSEDGYIVSSAFNFVQKPTSILVSIDGAKKRLPATIVGKDASRHLVLLKVETKQKLPVPEYVQREDLIVGQWTIALGRTFSPEAVSMSAGVLSAKHRIWGKAVQTDAKISPANYGGPLIDINGRVIGILAPMSPQGRGGELAGSEWYDSGIGFAAPMDDVMERLDVWKKGDLKPGIIGIGLKGNDVYAVPAEVASVRIKSPAADLGMKAGDKIVEINGAPITRQAQLKHALGPLYAGDEVRVIVERDGEKKDLGKANLVAELLPYDAPFLGFLPVRESEELAVRHLIAGSPAEAKLKPTDVVKKIGGKEIESVPQARDVLAGFEAGDDIELVVDRGGEEMKVTLKAASIPETVAFPPPSLAPEGLPEVETGVVDITLPEAKNICFAYVPESVRSDFPTGMLVWIHAPNKFDQDAMLAQWKKLADERGFILLAPKSKDAKRWTAPEGEFIKDVIEEMRKRYPIDSQRLVIGGESAGGAMAWLVARQNAELIRGVAAIGSPVPRGGAAPESDPQNRSAFYVTLTDQPRSSAAIRAMVEALRKAKLPVTFEEEYKEFGDEHREEIARWLDSLDRL